MLGSFDLCDETTNKLLCVASIFKAIAEAIIQNRWGVDELERNCKTNCFM